MPVSERQVIPISALGQSIGQVTKTVTVRDVTAFAAGIGAGRAAYFAELPLAPPSMIVALEWPLLNGTLYRHLLNAPQEVMERAVHLQQASRFHRPIVPGLGVTTSGKIVGMRQARRGVIVQVALATAGPEDEAIAQSTFTALFLDTTLDAEANGMSGRPPLAGEIDADHRAEREVPVGTAHIYTECSGIWNPIHTEIGAARRAGFDRPMVHGTWTWAVAMEQAIDWWCARDPQKLQSWTGDFVAPVIPGLPIELAGRLKYGEGRIEVLRAGRICTRAGGTVAAS